MKNENTNRKLRFKGLAGKPFPDWEERKFADVLSFLPTNSLSRSQLNYESGEIKNIHYGDIHTKFETGFDITNEEVPFINADVKTDKITEESFCQMGDLVIADASEDYNDIGKAIEILNTNGERIVAGLHTHLAREKEPMALGFKGYMMQSREVREQIMMFATGISVLGISKTNLAKVKLQIPSFEEQQKIAGFLSAIDKKILLLENELESLRDYKQGVMQALFAADAAAPQRRSAAATERRLKIRAVQVTENSATKLRFKDADGNNFPTWERRKLGELLTFKNGLNAEKHQYGKGVRFVNVLDIINNPFITHDRIIGSVDASERDLSSYGLAYGDILFQRSSETREEVGQANVYLDQEPAVFGGFVIRGRATASFNPVFMNYLLRSETIRKNVTSRSGGSTRYNIGQEALREVSVWLPCQEEQEKIANFLTALDEKISQSANQISEAQKYKKALLQAFFN